jgi:hypothetical protein
MMLVGMVKKANFICSAKRKRQDSSEYGKTTQATETGYTLVSRRVPEPPSAIYWLINLKRAQTMGQLHYLFAASLVLVPSAALAQEKYDTAPLPAICTKGAKTAMGETKADASAGGMAMPTDEAHKALAAGMAKMQAEMSAGSQATDIDIAFNCGMIPHHQGAISMARVELKYGKDPENRKLAEAIIKAQEKEVMAMLAWLEKHSK